MTWFLLWGINDAWELTANRWGSAGLCQLSGGRPITSGDKEKREIEGVRKI